MNSLYTCALSLPFSRKWPPLAHIRMDEFYLKLYRDRCLRWNNHGTLSSEGNLTNTMRVLRVDDDAKVDISFLFFLFSY